MHAARLWTPLWLGLCLLFSVPGDGAWADPGTEEAANVTITVVFNNVPHVPGLTTAWGFAAVVEGLEQTVLFDTGGDGDILLANMARLNIAPQGVDVVVLSHLHGDHTGGLTRFLEHNPRVTVHVPESFPASFTGAAARLGAHVETVGRPARLLAAVYSTGEMGDGIREQALVLDTPRGLVVITGCAHPDVTRIVRRAREYLHDDVHLLMGGFHLLGKSPSRIQAIIADLQRQGVERVAPSHCTGDLAIGLFRRAWGKDFIEGGCGAVIELEP